MSDLLKINPYIDEFDIKAATLLTTLTSGTFDNEDKTNSIKNFVDKYNGEVLSTLTPRRRKLIKYLDSEKRIKTKTRNLVNYFWHID